MRRCHRSLQNPIHAGWKNTRRVRKLFRRTLFVAIVQRQVWDDRRIVQQRFLWIKCYLWIIGVVYLKINISGGADNLNLSWLPCCRCHKTKAVVLLCFYICQLVISVASILWFEMLRSYLLFLRILQLYLHLNL